MTVLHVGPGQTFHTIASAVNTATSGDTIDVAAGTYTNDFLTIGKSLTLQAVGGMVKMVATVSPPNGKAMIVEGVPGVSIAINGFDISGVAVADKNGAAIRYEGGNLTLTNDYFHNNQEGLLGNGTDINGTITVRHSEFAFNGDGSGFTHNFYAGHIAAVTIDDSYFHDAVVGHEIKSRAISTTVTNSRIFDNNSTASYSIDAPNGGTVNISGNVIEQGPNSENLYLFAYGEEGATNPGTAYDPQQYDRQRSGGCARRVEPGVGAGGIYRQPHLQPARSRAECSRVRQRRACHAPCAGCLASEFHHRTIAAACDHPAANVDAGAIPYRCVR